MIVKLKWKDFLEHGTKSLDLKEKLKHSWGVMMEAAVVIMQQTFSLQGEKVKLKL